MASISPDQIGRLRDQQKNVLRDRLIEQEVCEYWGVVFSPTGLASLRRQDVTSFLQYDINRRWRDIGREDVTTDMPRLQEALMTLLDESQPLAKRLDELEPGRGGKAVAHLGKAKLTPILLVTHPRKYGVWNDYTERALSRMGLFPAFEPGWHLGCQYEAVNAVLLDLAATYRLTLWRLDGILTELIRSLR